MVANETIAVRCRGVTKTYGSGDNAVTALRGIDLDIRGGELMMLVGPSGCGKTTLISVIAAILDQDGGETEVFGESVRRMTQRRKTQYRGRNIGFVFQTFNLLPALNAAQNVAVPLMLNGMRPVAALKKAREMLERVGLGNRWKSMPSQLSGGQQQRVAIARSLVHDPKLIVCDEPTSSLDHDTGQKVMILMRELAVGEGRSLIIVTHDARIFGFADRMARMDDGKIVSVTTPNAAGTDGNGHGAAPVRGADRTGGVA